MTFGIFSTQLVVVLGQAHCRWQIQGEEVVVHLCHWSHWHLMVYDILLPTLPSGKCLHIAIENGPVEIVDFCQRLPGRVHGMNLGHSSHPTWSRTA